MTNGFTAFVNGVQTFTFVDTNQIATFSATNRVLHFFRDDVVTENTENPAGYVDYIRIYHGPLTPVEVSALYAASPPVTTVTRQGGTAQVCWKTAFGKTYLLQRRDSLGTAWADVGIAQPGTGATMCVNDTLITGAGQRFYRVRLGP